MSQKFERSRNIAEGVVFWITEAETGSCQVDDCERAAILDVGAPIAVKGIRACYRHLSFALEDVGFNVIQSAKRDRRRLIEVLKDRIPEERKDGFEYP